MTLIQNLKQNSPDALVDEFVEEIIKGVSPLEGEGIFTLEESLSRDIHVAIQMEDMIISMVFFREYEGMMGEAVVDIYIQGKPYLTNFYPRKEVYKRLKNIARRIKGYLDYG